MARLKLVALLQLLLAKGDPKGGRPPLDTNDPTAVLLSERRAKLLSYIRERPGISVTELRVLSDLGGGVFYHHLSKLEAANLIVIRYEHGNETRAHAYPVEEAPLPDPDAQTKGTETTFRVANHIVESGTQTAGDLSDGMGIPLRTVQYHLKKLVDLGLLKVRDEYHPPRYEATKKLLRSSRKE